jgi:hypothetical protein
MRARYPCTEPSTYMTDSTEQVTEPQIEQDTASKGMLFCPNCGHQSQYDGDWHVVKSGQGSRYRCPDCRTAIMSRPSQETPPPSFYNSDSWQMWRATIRLQQKILWV